MFFVDDFISTIDTRGIASIKTFIGGDSEELFKENLKIMPKDWYYRTQEITYNYNSLGFRCKEATDIDHKNYILFTGCSHTEGVGLELEKTFPYLVSKRLGIDYYNLAISASGIDVLEYNLLTWYQKFKTKPKFLIIQYPDHSRFLSQYPGYEQMIPNGSWEIEKDKNIGSFLYCAEESGFFYARKFLSNALLKSVCSIPIISVHYGGIDPYDSESLCLRKMDHARDLCHSGILSHEEIARQILAEIESRNLL